MLSLHEFVGGDVFTIQGQGHPIQGQIRQKIYIKIVIFNLFIPDIYKSRVWQSIVLAH